MEAKDTVMEADKIQELVYRKVGFSRTKTSMVFDPESDIEVGERVAEAQAEISFKAGIKEVAVAVNTYIATHGVRQSMFKWWQAKLKEWGIDKEVNK